MQSCGYANRYKRQKTRLLLENIRSFMLFYLCFFKLLFYSDTLNLVL